MIFARTRVSSETAWALALALFSWALVAPYLVGFGVNSVTGAYALGSERFWSGVSPYQTPIGGVDWFKYSPFLALLYRPFSLLPETAHVLLWAFLNTFLFWLGISRWFYGAESPERRTAWFWFALVLTSMELDGSTRYQQINAGLIGLTLVALAYYRDQKFIRAAFLLTLAANIKLLPALFLVSLIVRGQLRFWGGTAIALVGLFLAPAFVVGFGPCVQFHLEWYELLRRDSVAAGILDLGSVAVRGGWVSAKEWINWPIMIVTGVLLLLRPPKGEGEWLPWITLGLAGLLLVNPRTESPTFVLIAPVYFLGCSFFSSRGLRQNWPLAALGLAAAFLISISYNDIWPKALWNPGDSKQVSKPIGVFLLWCVAGIGLSKKKPPSGTSRRWLNAWQN